MPRTLRERFDAFVPSMPTDECWPWQGFKNNDGYGQIGDGSKVRLATHVALELAGRPRPTGLIALHSCDNPHCVNPNHLRWGTCAENTADMVAKGRHKTPWKPKTHCKRGHDLSVTGRSRGGSPTRRVCGECQNIWQREKRSARRASR